MKFTDITIVSGERYSERTQDTDRLVPGAVALFGAMLRCNPADFRVPIPHPAFSHYELQWTCKHPSAALATFWVAGQLATTSALVSGRDADVDRVLLEMLQQTIRRAYRTTPVEPGFDLLELTARPLIASVPWPNVFVAGGDMGIVADMETCVAAAFFDEGMTDESQRHSE